MKFIDYEILMKANPTHCGDVINKDGLKIDFYECPKYGEEANLIGVFSDYKMAFNYGFGEVPDADREEDYIPILQVLCEFERPSD